jgi:alkanesulfonate monooxygenase SsuD/methylene tetrahydromethanopterin reductase-like flavin-dependent oxidoreductase (luciferase family)
MHGAEAEKPGGLLRGDEAVSAIDIPRLVSHTEDHRVIDTRARHHFAQTADLPIAHAPKLRHAAGERPFGDRVRPRVTVHIHDHANWALLGRIRRRRLDRGGSHSLISNNQYNAFPAEMITFGLGMISAQRHPADTRTDSDIYRDILELAVEAERAGFDALWLSEHHFVDDGYMPSLLPVAAAIAVRTRTIDIGTGVLLAPLYPPLRLAEDAATVDLLSEGRLVLGLGAGYRDEEFAGLGVPKDDAGRRLRATIRTLRTAWSTEPVADDGATAHVMVTPKPYRPGGPPIWLGARGPAAIRRAGRLANGFLAARVTPEAFRQQVELVRGELRAQGRSHAEFMFSVHCPVFAWPGGGAWERMRESFHYVEWKYQDMLAEPYGTRSHASVVPPLTAGVEQRLRPTALIGTPAEVAEQIQAFHRAAGEPFHFIARLYWPGLEPALQREAVQVFADEVMPALRPARVPS